MLEKTNKSYNVNAKFQNKTCKNIVTFGFLAFNTLLKYFVEVFFVTNTVVLRLSTL